MPKVLKLAREVLKEEQLCDWCLGRQFAKLGHGLSNKERGRAIRISISLEGNKPFNLPDHCSICLGQFAKLDEWVDRILATVDGIEFNSFLVGAHIPSFIAEKEQILRQKYQIGSGESFKHDLNRELGKRLEKLFSNRGLGRVVDLESPDIAVLVNLVWDRVELFITPLFIYGRYRKLVRGIPQTKWPCRACCGRGCEHCDFTGKMYQESVEELISPAIKAAAQGSDSSFHGGGREDIDARMLGDGRPFIIEIKKPRIRNFDLKQVEQEVNEGAEGKVEAQGLRFVKREMVERIKSLRTDKVYRAKVRFAQPIDEEDLEKALRKLTRVIEQRTPTRVSHRRADRVRRRRVQKAKGQMIGEKGATYKAVIEIESEGGLYIKELISGDEGRTQPSLSEALGVQAEVVELDVIGIIGEF